jgi:hypothetical protein
VGSFLFLDFGCVSSEVEAVELDDLEAAFCDFFDLTSCFSSSASTTGATKKNI